MKPMDSGVAAGFIDHVSLELASALCYRAVSNAASGAWPGIEHWARGQAKCELKDWKQFQMYLNDRGVRNSLRTVPAPASVGDDPVSFLQYVVDQEQEVLDHLIAVADLADKAQDPDAEGFLEGYTGDQQKLLAHVSTLMEQLQAAGGDVAALQALDQRIGKKGK